MTNPMRGEAMMGDCKLVMDVEAFIRAEEATGLETQEMLTKLQAGVSLRLIRALVWAGMQREYPGAAMEAAAEQIEQNGLETVIAAIGKALEAALPSAGGKGRPAPTSKARAGTGKPS